MCVFWSTSVYFKWFVTETGCNSACQKKHKHRSFIGHIWANGQCFYLSDEDSPQENKCFRSWLAESIKGCWFRNSQHPVWTLLYRPSCQGSHLLLLPFLHITALHHTLHWKPQQKASQELDHFHNSRTQKNNAQSKYETTLAQSLWSQGSSCSFNLLTSQTGGEKAPPDNQLQRGTSGVDNVVLAGIKLQRWPSSYWLSW